MTWFTLHPALSAIDPAVPAPVRPERLAKRSVPELAAVVVGRHCSALKESAAGLGGDGFAVAYLAFRASGERSALRWLIGARRTSLLTVCGLPESIDSARLLMAFRTLEDSPAFRHQAARALELVATVVLLIS